MKKHFFSAVVLLLTISMVLVFSLTACGKAQETSPPITLEQYMEEIEKAKAAEGMIDDIDSGDTNDSDPPEGSYIDEWDAFWDEDAEEISKDELLELLLSDSPVFDARSIDDIEVETCPICIELPETLLCEDNDVTVYFPEQTIDSKETIKAFGYLILHCPFKMCVSNNSAEPILNVPYFSMVVAVNGLMCDLYFHGDPEKTWIEPGETEYYYAALEKPGLYAGITEVSLIECYLPTEDAWHNMLSSGNYYARHEQIDWNNPLVLQNTKSSNLQEPVWGGITLYDGDDFLIKANYSINNWGNDGQKVCYVNLFVFNLTDNLIDSTSYVTAIDGQTIGNTGTGYLVYEDYLPAGHACLTQPIKTLYLESDTVNTVMFDLTIREAGTFEPLLEEEFILNSESDRGDIAR